MLQASQVARGLEWLLAEEHVVPSQIRTAWEWLWAWLGATFTQSIEEHGACSSDLWLGSCPHAARTALASCVVCACSLVSEQVAA